jgi:hypothetical protein
MEQDFSTTFWDYIFAASALFFIIPFSISRATINLLAQENGGESSNRSDEAAANGCSNGYFVLICRVLFVLYK